MLRPRLTPLKWAGRPKRDVHGLNEDGMLLCNPRDKEASHRAAMGDILIDNQGITCKKCLRVSLRSV